MKPERLNSDLYETALTQWIVKQLEKEGITETHFSRSAGLGKNETDGRTFRKIKQGKRRWSMTDLCKVAGFFDLSPAAILAKVEAFYSEYGIMRPESLEKIMACGVDAAGRDAPLVSTWQKKGKKIILIDGDPDWKKAANGEFAVIIGKTCRELFRHNPEVTEVLETAWQKKAQAETQVSYNINNESARKLLSVSRDNTRLLFRLTAVFAPPENIILYAYHKKEGD